MEKLALRLSGQYESIFRESKYHDGVIVVENDTLRNYLKNSSENQDAQSEAVNFSNLPVDKMGALFKSNQKLKSDYFKFGLYNMLSEENFNLMLKNVECPFSGLETLTEYVLEENKSLVKILLLKINFYFLNNF
jgi:hypothetical protein